eukprot:1181466-Prorocentrum_minimum.AAC.5
MSGNQGNVPVAWLIERFTESCYSELRQTMTTLPQCTDDERKRCVARYPTWGFRAWRALGFGAESGCEGCSQS